MPQPFAWTACLNLRSTFVLVSLHGHTPIEAAARLEGLFGSCQKVCDVIVVGGCDFALDPQARLAEGVLMSHAAILPNELLADRGKSRSKKRQAQLEALMP